MEKKDISGKVRVNNASFNGVVNASSVDFKSSIVNNDNINACVSERGVAGFSPTANVVKSGDDVTITITDYKGTTTATIPDMSDEVERIESLIPHTASPTNKLVDSATLNSSVQTATSNFRGDWATYADIPTDVNLYPVDAAGVRTPTTNDYLVVMADEEQNGGTWRYKYVGLWFVDGKNGWQAEYQVNETPFTADQLAAINSGITSELVEEIGQGGGGGLEIGDIGIAPLGIDETKGKRRYLNGQLIIQDQYVQFTNKVKSAVALYPSLACTESEWQTTATMTVGGQVGKFVVDDNAGTIRLPKIIMPIQGLTDLSKLAEIVEAGLPNITASFKQLGTSMQSSGNVVGGALYETERNKYLQGGNADYAIDGGFDASLSNPIYGNSNTVQQEQIQYPYFIQVATGAETEDNIINEIELNNPFSLLDYKYSEYELNNISWLRSNGQYNSKAIYPAVYELLLKIYNGTETKAGVSVKLHTEAYTDYDFRINTADETFMLPIKVKLASGKAVVGNGMTLGLTNGTEIGGLAYTTPSGSSALAALKTLEGTNVAVTTLPSGVQMSYGRFGVVTDPTKSGIETSDSYLYLYFYVGETVQNANLINAGRIEEVVATKTDKVQAAQASMPSSKYIDLTLGASGTEYTAPANGWFYIHKTLSSTNQHISITNTTTNLAVQNQPYLSGANIKMIFPVQKGDVVAVTYNVGGTTNYFRFVYAQGEV